jgi:hypothetical protein
MSSSVWRRMLASTRAWMKSLVMAAPELTLHLCP